MCDASNSVLGTILGQRVRTGKPAHVIAYVSRTMDPTQMNYTTMEKELMAIGADNTVADHLSRIKGKVDPVPIRDDFPDEQLLLVPHNQPWFADICNFLVASTFLLGASKYYKEKIQSDAKHYIWDDPYL
ncbi:hypothetical protein CR513_44949, partial [Mucuna pruriens]